MRQEKDGLVMITESYSSDVRLSVRGNSYIELMNHAHQSIGAGLSGASITPTQPDGVRRYPIPFNRSKEKNAS